MFEAVVFAAGLSEVRDTGGAAVGPGQEVVCLVIQRGVAAPGKGALGVAEPEPLPQGLCDTITCPADLQPAPRRAGRSRHGDGIGAVGDQPARHRRRDRPVPVQHGGFVGGAQQGQHRDGDQDLRPRRRHTPAQHPPPSSSAAGRSDRHPARSSGPLLPLQAGGSVATRWFRRRRAASSRRCRRGAGSGSGPRPGPAGPGPRRWSFPRSPRRCRPGGRR